MGILHLTLVEEGSKMKFIAAACLVAATFAEPEAKADADAALLYGAYGYGGYASPYALGYRGHAGYAGYAGAYGAYPYAGAYGAYGYSAYGASPYAYSGYRVYSGLAGYTGYSAYGAYHYAGVYGGRYLGKRSADAEPEADANAYYGAYGYSAYGASPYAYSGYRGYSGLAGYTGYSAYGAYPYAGAYGGHYIGKRSADAEPEADANAYYDLLLVKVFSFITFGSFTRCWQSYSLPIDISWGQKVEPCTGMINIKQRLATVLYVDTILSAVIFRKSLKSLPRKIRGWVKVLTNLSHIKILRLILVSVPRHNDCIRIVRSFKSEVSSLFIRKTA